MGVAINISVVMEATGWGFFAVVLAIMFFPVTFMAAPWYALLAWGEPIPLVVSWGGMILAVIIGGIGSFISGDD